MMSLDVLCCSWIWASLHHIFSYQIFSMIFDLQFKESFLLLVHTMGVSRISFRRGNVLGDRHRGGSGGRRSFPGTKEFSKNFKILSRKLLKCIILAYFSNNLTNHALFFRAFLHTNFGDILRKF